MGSRHGDFGLSSMMVLLRRGWLSRRLANGKVTRPECLVRAMGAMW
jgi:hypothetical protein